MIIQFVTRSGWINTSDTMVKVEIVFAVILVCVAVTLAADCPHSSKVQNCTPKCLHDSECSAIGGKCCSNICNGRSCAQSNVLSNSGDRGSSSFGSKNSGGAGTYCGNVKCSPYEKCDTDRQTKRPACVRS